MRLFLRLFVGRACLPSLIFTLALFTAPREARAIVGQAERYDEFEEKNLEEFHDSLVNEEKKAQLDRSDELKKILKERKKTGAKAKGAEKKEVDLELQKLQRELLNLPKRDRMRILLENTVKYDSNIGRRVPRQEKGDTVFNSVGNVEFDLSGKKTDLRFELRGGRQWNIHFSEKDYMDLEERLRSRRKFFKKITESFQSKVARHNEKTVEIDDNKLRWDLVHNSATNYAFSRKLSLNVDLSSNKRLFTQEAFDQDSSWEVTAAPSGFWNFTPKSRISAGYKFGANRIRTKKGDTNSHEVHVGYFGQVTKKSSTNLDLAWSHQTPRELETAESDTFTVGTGFIYQITPKTQGTLQFIRALQNTTSNVAPTAVTEAAGTGAGEQVTKLDTNFVNDSISLSLNSRLTRKITAVFNFSPSHVRTKAEQKRPAEDLKSRQFTFPVTLSLTYLINRWMTLRLGYTFSFRTGNENVDTNRSHLWSGILSVSF